MHELGLERRGVGVELAARRDGEVLGRSRLLDETVRRELHVLERVAAAEVGVTHREGHVLRRVAEEEDLIVEILVDLSHVGQRDAVAPLRVLHRAQELVPAREAGAVRDAVHEARDGDRLEVAPRVRALQHAAGEVEAVQIVVALCDPRPGLRLLRRPVDDAVEVPGRRLGGDHVVGIAPDIAPPQRAVHRRREVVEAIQSELVVLRRLVEGAHLEAGHARQIDAARLERRAREHGAAGRRRVEARAIGGRERLVTEHDQELRVEPLEAVLQERRAGLDGAEALGQRAPEVDQPRWRRGVARGLPVRVVDRDQAVHALADLFDLGRVVAVRSERSVPLADDRREADAPAVRRAEADLVAERLLDGGREGVEHAAAGAAVEGAPDAEVGARVVAVGRSVGTRPDGIEHDVGARGAPVGQHVATGPAPVAAGGLAREPRDLRRRRIGRAVEREEGHVRRRRARDGGGQRAPGAARAAVDQARVVTVRVHLRRIEGLDRDARRHPVDQRVRERLGVIGIHAAVGPIERERDEVGIAAQADRLRHTGDGRHDVPHVVRALERGRLPREDHGAVRREALVVRGIEERLEALLEEDDHGLRVDERAVERA